MTWRCVAGVVAACAGLATGARGQGVPDVAPPSIQFMPVAFASHPVSDPARGEVIAACEVSVPDARWVRVRFGAVQLAGDPAGDGSFLRVTSLLDGASQTLTAEHLAQWAGTSAYFNGEGVRIEHVSRGGHGVDRLAVDGLWYGRGHGYDARSICGATDDRVPSAEPAQGRLLNGGCTAFIIDDPNHTFLAAGHCYPDAGTVIQFNVPLSNAADGALVHPPPRDQYAVEPRSAQFAVGGPGADWSYFGVYPNTETGLTPYHAQGAAYTLDVAPAVDGQTLRLTGYGTSSTIATRQYNQTQRTHTGLYAQVDGTIIRHDADSTGGNSGAPLYLLDTRTVVGIHGHAGCTAAGGLNQGTSLAEPGLLAALASPRGVCRTARDGVWGDLFAVGDLANNVGALSAESATLGQLAIAPPNMQGLAFDWNRGVLFAVASPATLYQIDPATGIATALGEVSGVAGTLTALAIDSRSDTLYAVAQASGQLYAFTPDARQATPVGPPGGGTVGGLEFDPVRRVLFALDDAGGATRLVRLDQSTGARTIIGSLGAGASDCNGLAYRGRDARLYTIQSTTGRLLEIDPATGAARDVGATNGLFGSGFGLAGRVAPPLCARLDYNRDGNADQDDVAALIDAIASGVWTVDPDLNADGQTDMTDVADLVQAIAGGC